MESSTDATGMNFFGRRPFSETHLDGTVRVHYHDEGDSCYRHDVNACTVEDCPCCSFRDGGDEE